MPEPGLGLPRPNQTKTNLAASPPAKQESLQLPLLTIDRSDTWQASPQHSCGYVRKISKQSIDHSKNYNDSNSTRNTANQSATASLSRHPQNWASCPAATRSNPELAQFRHSRQRLWSEESSSVNKPRTFFFYVADSNQSSDCLGNKNPNNKPQKKRKKERKPTRFFPYCNTS